MGCFFSWGYCNKRGLNKGWFLSQSIFDEHVFLLKKKGFWMFTPIGERVFSLMFQHGVGNKGHWRPSSFSFVCIL
jgi:hypothetical protein